MPPTCTTGLPHAHRRFTCPLQVGNTYRQAYLRARGRRCFDHDHYSKHNLDVRLAGVAEGERVSKRPMPACPFPCICALS